MENAKKPTLDELIERTRSDSGFEAMIVANLRGQIVAAARSDGTEAETMETLVDMALRIVVSLENVIALAKIGESTFFDWEGRQVICRRFEAPGTHLLIVLAPPGVHYKRAMARFIKRAQALLGT